MPESVEVEVVAAAAVVEDSEGVAAGEEELVEPSVITVEKLDILPGTAPTRPKSAEKEAAHAIIAKKKAIWQEIAPTVTPRGVAVVVVVETRGHATTVTDRDTLLGTAQTAVEEAVAAAGVDGNRLVTTVGSLATSRGNAPTVAAVRTSSVTTVTRWATSLATVPLRTRLLIRV